MATDGLDHPENDAASTYSAEDITSLSLGLEQDKEFTDIFEGRVHSPTICSGNSFDCSVIAEWAHSTGEYDDKRAYSNPKHFQNIATERGHTLTHQTTTEPGPYHRHSRPERIPKDGLTTYTTSHNITTRPKRPVTAYNLFFKWKRRELVRGTPQGTLTFSKIGKLIGSEWKTLCESDRAEYVQQAKRDQDRYRREMAAWKKEEQRQKRHDRISSAKQEQQHHYHHHPRRTRSLENGHSPVYTYSSSSARVAISPGWPLPRGGESHGEPDHGSPYFQRQLEPHRSYRSPNSVVAMPGKALYNNLSHHEKEQPPTRHLLRKTPPSAQVEHRDALPSDPHAYYEYPPHSAQSAYNHVHHYGEYQVGSPPASMYSQSNSWISERDPNYFPSQSPPPPPPPDHWYTVPHPPGPPSPQPSALRSEICPHQSPQYQPQLHSCTSRCSPDTSPRQPIHSEMTRWPTSSPPPPPPQSLTYKRYRHMESNPKRRGEGVVVPGKIPTSPSERQLSPSQQQPPKSKDSHLPFDDYSMPAYPH